jgi:hypothetical protein
MSETDIVLLNLANPSVKIIRRIPLKTIPNFILFFSFQNCVQSFNIDTSSNISYLTKQHLLYTFTIPGSPHV